MKHIVAISLAQRLGQADAAAAAASSLPAKGAWTGCTAGLTRVAGWQCIAREASKLAAAGTVGL